MCVLHLVSEAAWESMAARARAHTPLARACAIVPLRTVHHGLAHGHATCERRLSPHHASHVTMAAESHPQSDSRTALHLLWGGGARKTRATCASRAKGMRRLCGCCVRRLRTSRVQSSMARVKRILGTVRRVVEAAEMVLWTWPRPSICMQRVRCDVHRGVAGHAGLIACITAHACTARSKYSYARVPQVADYNSEVSWIIPARVIRPKALWGVPMAPWSILVACLATAVTVGLPSCYSGGLLRWANVLAQALLVSTKSSGGQLDELDFVWSRSSVDSHMGCEGVVHADGT